jgi:hypothetical protein
VSVLTSRFRGARFARLFPFAIASVAWGCVNDAVYSAQFAPGFVPQGRTVSVLGVYKDGQMSSGAWDGIEPRLARALGATRCGAGYTDALSSTHNAIAGAIDDYARSEGPSDDLLGRLAPAATGNLILVVTIAGRLPAHDEEKEDAHSSSSAMGPGGGRSRMGGPSPGPTHGPQPISTDELDLSTTLYSVSEKKAVAVVSERYLGKSVDEAVSNLATKLAQSLPGASCAGWNWDAPVDVDAIRHSIESP